MSRFNTLVLTLAVGTAIGTLIRPGIPEIVIVAAVVCSAATLSWKVAVPKVHATN